MSWIMGHPLIALCYGFLYFSVISLWIPFKKKIPLWLIMLGMAIIFGLIANVLDFIALVPIIGIGIMAYHVQFEKAPMYLRIIAGVLVFLLGASLSTHILPGFNNFLALDKVFVSQDAIPFNLHLAFDKTVVGLFILGFGHTLISSRQEWKDLFKRIFVWAILVIIVLIIMSYALGYVRFDPKFSSHFYIWAITNILFVCIAEEAFFRGFIQKYLVQFFSKMKNGEYLAIMMAALLFGIGHLGGGIKYVILATFAGLGYGWVYNHTKRIEASILTHFTLNLTHFLFFTYPALASAF